MTDDTKNARICSLHFSDVVKRHLRVDCVIRGLDIVPSINVPNPLNLFFISNEEEICVSEHDACKCKIISSSIGSYKFKLVYILAPEKQFCAESKNDDLPSVSPESDVQYMRK